MCINSDNNPRNMDHKVSNEASSLRVALSKSQQYGGMSGRHLVNDNGSSETRPHQVLHETIMNFIQDSNFWSVVSVLFIVGWSCVCAWGSIKLKAIAADSPGGRAALWLEWISGIEAIVGVLGVLFTFSLVSFAVSMRGSYMCFSTCMATNFYLDDKPHYTHHIPPLRF